MSEVNVLGKLQKEIIKLEKDNTKLRDLLAAQKEKNVCLKNQLKYLEKMMEEKIEKKLNETTAILLEENRRLKEENEHLKRILNHDSNNTGIPTSKTPIGKEKRRTNRT